MNKNDAAILIYVQLLNTHMNDSRLASVNRNARAGCIAELAVYYAGLLDHAFVARDEDEVSFAKEVREFWRLGAK